MIKKQNYIASSYNFKLSIVVPVYNEEKTISIFLKTIQNVLKNITENYEIIFALDPSQDHTQELIEVANKIDNRIKLLQFSRRYGQPAATWAGLYYATGDAVIPIDCDMQDPPELISEMVRLWKDEGYKVVIPQRKSRKGENFLKKIISYMGYWFINKIASVDIPRNTGDFRLLDRKVVDELMRLRESHGFLRGLTSLVGFKTYLLPFNRLSRAGGKGKYNRITGNLRIGFNGIVAFSDFLLNMITVLGLTFSALSISGAAFMVCAKLFGWWEGVTGVATMLVMVLLLFGMLFLALGIMGAYISRIYDEVKMRPKFIVEKFLGLEVSRRKKNDS
ncbi:MAG: glycosyltransferase family 2 protein [Holosporaceae bacterium]|jgi:dolichol-phosphate mannosyltransferase|nr:glycosyltransferase family 2 protein [Holosporaceae bacterium]